MGFGALLSVIQPLERWISSADVKPAVGYLAPRSALTIDLDRPDPGI
jgi:hypothetical protein